MQCLKAVRKPTFIATKGPHLEFPEGLKRKQCEVHRNFDKIFMPLKLETTRKKGVEF